MQLITKEDFDARYPHIQVEETDFELLAQLAATLTEYLCFGRQNRNPQAAKQAMEEMIVYWAERGGKSAADARTLPKSERVGNYSVTHREEGALTVRGVTVSPTALLILDNGDLRNRNL